MSLNPQLFPPIPPVQDSAPRPFWTVLIPAYKPEYLPQTLRSLMEQDPGAQEMEILVLDDCSPHKLEPIVRQICGQRANYVHHARNLGTYANENAGLTMARGQWIHILNDDDWVLPGFYSTLHDALKDQPPTVGAGCCRQTNVDQAGREIAPQINLREKPGIIENWLMRVGAANPVHPVGVVVRRSTFEHLGGFYPKLNYCADWEFNKRSAVFYDWWYEPKIMACYRHHLESITYSGQDSGEQLRDINHAIRVSESYLPADKRQQISDAAREAYGLHSLKSAARALANGQNSGAIHRIQAGLEICQSAKMLEQLALLITQPNAKAIRDLLPHFFKMIEVHSNQKKPAPGSRPQ